MPNIKLSVNQQAAFQETRRQFREHQAELQAQAEAERVRRNAEIKEGNAKRLLCERAIQTASKVANHTLGYGNRMGADKEMFSDWATLSRGDDEETVMQASVHRFIPEDSHDTRAVTIELRLKDAHHEVWSKSETIVTFDITGNKILLHDNDLREQSEIRPDTTEFFEVADLLIELERAEFDAPPGEPLTGV